MTPNEIWWAIYVLIVLAGFLGCSTLHWRQKYKLAMDAAKWIRQQNDYLRHVIKNSDTVILQRLKDQIEAEEAYDRV